MPSVREDVEVSLHEHRFLVTKLLESLSTASLYVSTLFSLFEHVERSSDDNRALV